MLFNSLSYVILVAVSLVVYWMMSSLRIRQGVVFIASLYFYATWNASFTLMLLGLIAFNWGMGHLIDKTGKKIWLIIAAMVDLGLLSYFKYFNFFAENIVAALGYLKVGATLPHLEVILPLGISFYVFELISYLADVQQGKIKHERDPLAFSLFVLFFPHLIAGPICRAGQFIPQLKTVQKLDWENVYNGMYFFLAGFALKCGMADGLAPYVNVIFAAPAKYSGFDNLMATIGFGVQILCDFWGYSLMALGTALLFGYTLPFNFNAPYAALSIRDFWRRWHMTLSSWLRDYLYIALGGSRVDREWKIQRNLALTMLLGGLWHGASWNFVIWGGIHGLALALNRWFEESKNLDGVVRKTLSHPIVAWGLTMLVVFSAWIFFRARHFDEAMSMLTHIFTFDKGWMETKLAAVFFELLVLFVPLHWLVHRTTYKSSMAAQGLGWQLPAVAALAAFSVIYYINGTQFIYFQF